MVELPPTLKLVVDASSLLLPVAIAALAPCLKLSASALVLARLSWGHCVAAAVLLAGLWAPAAFAMASGGIGAALWLLLAAMALYPYLAGWYLGSRVAAFDGHVLGWRRAAEMSGYAVCMAVTVGIAAWGAFDGS